MTNLSTTFLDVNGKRIDERPLIGNRQNLIEGLNRDLAGEYQAILMYTHYSAKLMGPYLFNLRSHFQVEIVEVLGHAQFLADHVAALGGEPTVKPNPIPPADKPREMLVQALKAEKQAIADYSERIRQAEHLNEINLKVGLEDQLAEETLHKKKLERILAGWDQLERVPTQSENRWQDDGGQQ